jgi:2-methylaconitate cis-trans-isomerase PrpF
MTQVRVFNVNTSSIIDVMVQTPGGRVTYEGDAKIDGVDGTAAPVLLNFEGASADGLLPTGAAIDRINGVEVTCLVAGQTVVMMAASDLGVRGDETPAELDANRPLCERIEAIRLQSGQLMGLGDVSKSVLPKPILLSRADEIMSVRSRYFTPHSCHQSHAATGAVAVATAFVTAGTVANRLAPPLAAGQHSVGVLHPSGRIDIALACEAEGVSLRVTRASLVRTARKIMMGTLFLPRSTGDLW